MLNLPHNGHRAGHARRGAAAARRRRARPARKELETTQVSDAIGRYIVALGRRTRDLPGVELGVSSRAMIHLMSAAKANARLNGRITSTVEDVQEMAPFVLRHRLILEEGYNRRRRPPAGDRGDPRADADGRSARRRRH